MAEGRESRTEKPTPRRLQKAREKGQIARSREVPPALVLLGGMVLLYYAGQSMVHSLASQMRDLLRMRAPSEITVSYLQDVLQTAALQLAPNAGLLMAVALTLGIAANAIQGGLALSWKALGFRFERLSPANGLARVFSKNGLVELAKSTLLIVVVAAIAYRVLAENMAVYPRLVVMGPGQLLYWMGTITHQIFIRVAVFLAVLALADYGFQKYRFIEQMKMTKQEVREEFKELEGDPLVRARIRRIQRELARRRMMAEVPRADVVITNPTHYAVALSYKMESMDAPRVVAKGVGFLALKIKELAQQHNVPMVENRALAQTLYRTVDIGEQIPASLYQAVAEILAYIYKARSAWNHAR
ncbi:MAG: flagellar biosynthesis protein FlhB [Acidobacteria bacterium]|nr:flagellar biosynthesis protein FlhB [Acidobacteriota bacterium]